MANKDDDVQVLIKKDGKYYTLKPKQGISPDLAREKRIIISCLFKDQHEFVEVKIADF